jgi:hypothetical protein
MRAGIFCILIIFFTILPEVASSIECDKDEKLVESIEKLSTNATARFNIILALKAAIFEGKTETDVSIESGKSVTTKISQCVKQKTTITENQYNYLWQQVCKGKMSFKDMVWYMVDANRLPPSVKELTSSYASPTMEACKKIR